MNRAATTRLTQGLALLLLVSISVLALACSGGDAGPPATATPEPPTPTPVDAGWSATTIVLKGLSPNDDLRAGHATVVMTVSLGGSVIRYDQDVLFDQLTLYVKNVALGTTTETVERSDGICVRQGSLAWQHQPATVPNQIDLSRRRSVLHDLLTADTTGLERLPDMTLDDGRDVYVLRAKLSASGIKQAAALLLLQVGAGANASIDSEIIEVMVDKQSFLIDRTQYDITYTIRGKKSSTDIVATNDRPNLPPDFPPDLPQSCAGGSA